MASNLKDVETNAEQIDELKTNLTTRILANEAGILENKDNIENVDDFQNEIDELKTNLATRIEAVETNIADNINVIETNQANISSNSDDLQVLFKRERSSSRFYIVWINT